MQGWTNSQICFIDEEIKQRLNSWKKVFIFGVQQYGKGTSFIGSLGNVVKIVCGNIFCLLKSLCCLEFRVCALPL